MERAAANPFDMDTNRSGCINLGTAENKVSLGEGPPARVG